MINLTEQAQQLLKDSKLSDGVMVLFVQGSTGAITTIEFEPGLQKDFPKFLERIIPSNINYEHHLTWHDDNGRGHVRAALLKPDLSIPFQNSQLVLGTWQQIILIELDTIGRDRTVFVQLLGK